MIHRPVNDEDLGIRLHEVNRQRAVDRATERLRNGLRADWHYLTADDLRNLQWVVGELWAIHDRDEWDSMHFSKLELDEARRLVSIGDRLRRHGTSKMNALLEATAVVRRAGIRAESSAPSADRSLLTY